jgi:hypothetical protein
VRSEGHSHLADLLRRRLADLGLVRVQGVSQRARIQPLIRADLRVEGTGRAGGVPKGARISSSADKQRAAKSDVERAVRLLRGESASFDEIRDLAERLKNARYFCYARRLFARARREPDAARQLQNKRLHLVQRQGPCTDRDIDLPAGERFSGALRLLDQGDLNAPDPSGETLGLAGATYKYQWKLSGRRGDLEESLRFYGRVAARGVEHDYGYTAINACFTLDVLAELERLGSPDVAGQRAQQARALREQITQAVPPMATQRSTELRRQWFTSRRWQRPASDRGGTTRRGTGCAKASPLTRPHGSAKARRASSLRSRSHRARTWPRVARRCGRCACWHKTRRRRCTRRRSARSGLALSGGGFRAFGVLARMAEFDMLRQVEVLSCVSGGSIVGAHYYLEVRRLPDEKQDGEIMREDYIEIVRRLEREFLAAIQTCAPGCSPPGLRTCAR